MFTAGIELFFGLVAGVLILGVGLALFGALCAVLSKAGLLLGRLLPAYKPPTSSHLK